MRRLVVSVALLLAPAVAAVAAPPAFAEKVVDPARQAFIDEADDTCDASAVRLEKALATFETHKIEGFGTKGAWRADPKAVGKYISTIAAPEMRTLIKSLRALGVPVQDTKEVKTILDTAQKELDAMAKKGADAAFTNPFEKTSKLMSDFGFTICGSPDRPSDRAKKAAKSKG